MGVIFFEGKGLMSCYHIWTIGCQMNKADSERIGSCLEQIGYLTTPRAEEAEIIVLNSCVVRQSAENRVVNKLGALKSLKRGPQNPVLALTSFSSHRLSRNWGNFWRLEGWHQRRSRARFCPSTHRRAPLSPSSRAAITSAPTASSPIGEAGRGAAPSRISYVR